MTKRNAGQVMEPWWPYIVAVEATGRSYFKGDLETWRRQLLQAAGDDRSLLPELEDSDRFRQVFSRLLGYTLREIPDRSGIYLIGDFGEASLACALLRGDDFVSRVAGIGYRWSQII